jgi:hypothetical protein
MGLIGCTEMLNTKYQSVQDNIQEERRRHTLAVSLEERFKDIKCRRSFWDIHCRVYLCHQIDSCVTGKAEEGIDHTDWG